jgi:hypothetical protein
MSAQWRRAPFALGHHPTVLLAVFVAAGLIGVTASSAPFLSAAVGSHALKNKLVELTPLSTGLVIESGVRVPSGSVAQLSGAAARGDATFDRLTMQRGPLGTPVRTLILGDGLNVHVSSVGHAASPSRVVVMSRTDALAHVRVLSRVSGPGVWISDVTARALHVQAGDTIQLSTDAFADPVSVAVKGTYRALADDVARPYWTNFVARIYPSIPGDSPPPPFMFVDRSEFFRLSHALGQDVFGSVHELPVDPRHLTLGDARRLERRFAILTKQLVPGRTTAAHELGCFRLGECTVLSSLSAAVSLADADMDAIAPIVTLLSDFGIIVALAVAGAAGAFAVRRRQTEAMLMFARGEHVAVFSARTALEVLPPMIVGALAGFGVAAGLTGVFAPDGTVHNATLWTGLEHTCLAGLAGLGLVALAAGFSFLGLNDAGAGSRRWLRYLPWELPVLAAGLYQLIEIRSGRGLAMSGSSETGHPTLAVVVLPLLLVAGATGVAARAARLLLRRFAPRARRLPTPAFLAVRRLVAAEGLLVALAVMLAVSLGGLVYAEMLLASLRETTAEKAYIGIGSDVQGQVASVDLPPRSLRYPAATVSWGNGAAMINTPAGEQVDVLTVDPKTLPSVLHWKEAWGPSPVGLLGQLAAAPASPLPVILVGSMPDAIRALSMGGGLFPVRVLGRLHAFPGMTTNPLVVTSRGALARAANARRVFDPLGVEINYVWVKGPPAAAGEALKTSRLDAIFVTTVDTFWRNPDVLLATRTYSYLRVVAIGSALLSLICLMLYLQARQRSQAIASALSRRMGLSRATEVASLFLELAALLLFSFALGAVLAITAALPVARHVDLLPEYAPAPLAVIPELVIWLTLAGLVLVAAATAALTSWSASRMDVGKELRVA